MKISIIALLLLFSITQCQIYQIPPIVDQSDAQIRLDEIYFLDEPKLGLNKIYKREVYQKIINQTNANASSILTNFEPCSQSPPQIQFSYIGYASLQKRNSNETYSTLKNYLIYDYQQLQVYINERKSQYKNIIDMVFYDQHVFTISSTGVIRIYRVDERYENGIQSRDTMEAINWDKLSKSITKQNKEGNQWIEYKNIGKGYFQFMNGNQILLFVNGKVLILLDVRTFKTTFLSHTSSNSTSFVFMENFQSISKIDQSHFAVLDRKQGVIIYKISKRPSVHDMTEFDYTLQKVDEINKQSFGGMYQEDEQMIFMDIKYNSEKEYLLLLDYEKGVFRFNRQGMQMISEGDQKPKFVLNNNVIFKKQCNLMQLSPKSETLYLVCNKFYRIFLDRWPIIEEKSYPHPMISIREIFIQQEQNIIILAGYQVFKVMYLDRPTAYFKDDMLDKIVFDKDIVITANQYHIVAYNYMVEKPQITCLTNNQSLIGLHHLVLRTTAECHPSFLKQVKTNEQQNQNFQPDDICIYTVYKNVYVWQNGQLPIQGLAIFLIAIGIFGVLMMIWYLTTMWRAKRAMAYLFNLASNSSAKLVQSNVPRSQTFKEAQEQLHQQNFETNSQINKNNQLEDKSKAQQHL